MIPPPVKNSNQPATQALRGFDFFPRAVGVLRQREKHQFGTAVASPLAAMSGLCTVPRWHGLLDEKHPDRRELSNSRSARFSGLIGQGYRSRYANKNRHALGPLRWISVKSFNGQHHVLRSAAASFFSSAPAFFVCMANNPVRDHHKDALNTIEDGV